MRNICIAIVIVVAAIVLGLLFGDSVFVQWAVFIALSAAILTVLFYFLGVSSRGNDDSTPRTPTSPTQPSTHCPTEMIFGDYVVNEPSFDYTPRCLGTFGIKSYTNDQEANFWNGALRHISDFAKCADYLSAYEFIRNILASKNNAKYAYELYTLIDHAIIELYPSREYRECTDAIIDLGMRGLFMIDDYIRQVNELKGNPVWRFPTKLVILLERRERYEEAISICDIMISKNVIDSGYGTFEVRREKLVSKYEKASGR